MTAICVGAAFRGGSAERAARKMNTNLHRFNIR